MHISTSVRFIKVLTTPLSLKLYKQDIIAFSHLHTYACEVVDTSVLALCVLVSSIYSFQSFLRDQVNAVAVNKYT